MVRIFILRQGKRDGRTDVDHRGKGEGIVSSYGVSYEKAAEFLKKFTGLEVSRNKIHKMSLEEGKRIEAWQEDRRTEVSGQSEDVQVSDRGGKEVFYIQVDGTGVNDRESKEWMECKVGACFSQGVEISKNRVWLMDKKSYACIEDAESFGEKFYLDCVRHGVDKAKKVFVISDGARWIRNLKDNYFPEAIGVLDIWHLEREFKRVFGDKEGFINELKGLALNGKAKAIVERLWHEALRTRGEIRRRIKGLIEYVSNNHDWIDNIPLVEGYGSGPVEKTVDITVARRFKKRGMSWYKRGANPLLMLRLLKLNGEWDTYWQERRKELTQYAA